MASTRKRISVSRHLTCQSVCLETGLPRIYAPSLKQTQLTSKFQMYELGQRDPSVPHKTVVLVGATGSGKSTLINGLFNYIIGVDWEDQFRFKLVQEQPGNQARSQTQVITVYTIHHQKGFRIPYTISFIDTPGYGDTSGVLKDNKISDQLRAFFTSNKQTGISHIDAIGFVVQSALPRLTTAQQYIFDSILTLFGKDVAQNIYFLVTFADASKPQVLAGIQQAQLPYQSFFKFNNSVLYTSKTSDDTVNYDSDDSDDDIDFNNMYWKMGEKSYGTFLQALMKAESKSLQMTQKVLVENKALQLSIKGLQTEIRLGLNKLEQIEQEKAVMKQYEDDLENNRDFTYTIEEEKTEAIPVSTGQYTTNCTLCNRTCHERCSEREDSRKHACSAMSNGSCTVCPGKCPWTKHSNQPYLYRVKRSTVTKCAEDLRKKYLEARANYDALRCNSQLERELKQVEGNVMNMVKDIRDCTARLEDISLKSNPMSTSDYIDLQLETEKSLAEPGWQWRIRQLQKLKQQEQYKIQVAKGNFSPFKRDKDENSPVMGLLNPKKFESEDDDDDQYRHPKIEKLQTDLNLKDVLTRSRPTFDSAEENQEDDDNGSCDTSEEQLQESTGGVGNFKKTLAFQLSKRLSLNNAQ